MSDHEAKRRSANGVSLRHTLFNRAVFCHAVEQVASELESGAMKLALLVEIDGSVSIRQEQGFVMLDDLAGHLAERVVGLLGDAGYEYHVMRIADAAVAAVVSGYQGGDDGEMLAGNLCEHLEEQPYSAGGQFMPYTVSVGTARITSWKADGEAILGQADTACREAAAVSGNSYVVSKAADEQRNEPWNDSSELHRAFSDNRLQGCFQALMGASGRALKTNLRLYQMRVRLINDSGTSLLPKEFMPRLEAAGLLQTLDRWVLRHGVARLKSLYERNADPIGLFLRVTNASLVDSEFTSWLDELLQHAGSEVVSRSIILELEPQDVLTHSEETKQAVESLRARHGFRFALVNVPNEAVLRKCFDHIAFDFVKGAVLTDSESAQSAQDLSRLAMVLAAARDLGATTTADRIECAVVLSWAIRHQIDYVQGNFVSGPADHILENNITQNVEIA
jgi:EAL domain-containing protein (putative c-di-GMP-specific phosphodiesterase class I)/GGDEF domain-containing protein